MSQYSLFDAPDATETIVPGFQEIGLDLDAEYCCPECGYEWSGGAACASLYDEDGSGSRYGCPRCCHVWRGAPRPPGATRNIAFGERAANGALVVPKVEKPPYRIPSMLDIVRVPWNGYRVVSTFSGCGGSCLGYRMAGFKVLWASEFIPEAQKTYRLNHPDSILDTRDIRDVKPEEILEATGMSAGDIDVLDGSPPCASFSLAGARERSWGEVRKYSDTEQRTDDLFFEYIRILRGLMPKTFIAENVTGLTRGVARGWFLDIMRELRTSGYRVRAKILDASYLGVPQARQRLFFVGVRCDLRSNQPEIAATPFKLPGEEESAAPVAAPPFFTVAGEREFTIAEIKRLCSFPTSFQLTGSYQAQYERLGRAVCPVMMAHIANAVRTKILDRITPDGGALIMPEFPEPLPYRYSVRDALPYIKRITGRTGPQFRRVESELDEPMNTIMVSDPEQTRYIVEVEEERG